MISFRLLKVGGTSRRQLIAVRFGSSNGGDDGGNGTALPQQGNDKMKDAMDSVIENGQGKSKNKYWQSKTNDQGTVAKIRTSIPLDNNRTFNSVNPSGKTWSPSGWSQAEIDAKTAPPLNRSFESFSQRSGRVYKGSRGGRNGGGARKGRGRGRGRGRGERGSFDDRGGEIDQALMPFLYDVDYFETAARAGKTLDTDGMDELDAFFSNSFMQALKTKSGTFRQLEKTPEYHKVQIPQARPMLQLAQSLQPNIYTAAPDSRGYELAAQAWEVLGKNQRYSEEDREIMCNTIARITNKILEDVKNLKDGDLIFDPSFRKGLQGIEEEERRKALEAPKEVKLHQKATDW
eukprot:CAMPEP_0182428108 /NCGR_PEP_ID=MMETSP1167-20130531/21025_1 /TAXON_ID=2988 /ORGANISM="Mallomonas Sp, Strain CCMP3275" /LENGTH=346 /DNA_ID=CAMNT_0024610787 /DNA_START=111 /DNA_END=1148 /DNA_ORIENTATION=-